MFKFKSLSNAIITLLFIWGIAGLVSWLFMELLLTYSLQTYQNLKLTASHWFLRPSGIIPGGNFGVILELIPFENPIFKICRALIYIAFTIYFWQQSNLILQNLNIKWHFIFLLSFVIIFYLLDLYIKSNIVAHFGRTTFIVPKSGIKLEDIFFDYLPSVLTPIISFGFYYLWRKIVKIK